MRCSLKFGLAVMVVSLSMVCVSAKAQTSSLSTVGRAPTQQELSAWDISVGPSGKELPPGSGTAIQGEPIFEVKCAMCHGADMKGGTFRTHGVQSRGPNLLSAADGQKLTGVFHPVRGTANYRPFATTIYDFIQRAMPREMEGTLKPDEIYAL